MLVLTTLAQLSALPTPMAAASTAAGDADVMADDEIDNIRNMVMRKNKNPKSRKKRSSQGRGTANSAAGGAKLPPPLLAPAASSDEPQTTEAANGHHSSSGAPDATCAAEGAAAAAASTLPTTPGEPPQAAGEGDEALSKVEGREALKEVKTDFADSDDEIPLPEGVPGFEALEEAMLVRELTKDRLPGKIVRGSDGSGNTASRKSKIGFGRREGNKEGRGEGRKRLFKN